MPMEPAVLASAARRAKARQDRASAGQDARSERPAEWAWATPSLAHQCFAQRLSGDAAVNRRIG
jgi:hypothetical protein